MWRDVHGPKDEFEEGGNPFLKLLWERGVQHEADIIENCGFEFVDCSKGSEAERIAKTKDALANRAAYIYQGVLAHGDLFGIPDLLHFVDGEYLPIELKSGSATEGSDDSGKEGKLKKEYAVQLALYCDILNRRGLNNSRKAFIIDTTGEQFSYSLNDPKTIRPLETYWEFYERIRSEVASLLANEKQNDPAMCSSCSDCGWYNSCKKWCAESDDLTQLVDFGRTKRDIFKQDLGFADVVSLLSVDSAEVMRRKKELKKTGVSFLRNITDKTIETAQRRGRLLKENGEPLMHSKFEFPEASTELFFDIETDPTQDFVYLHGFWIRSKEASEFKHFTVRKPGPEAEMQKWMEVLDFVRSFNPSETAVYYYSSFEKTSYRRLQKKYPEAVSLEELDSLFARPNVIDLYTDIIRSRTDWPLGSYSIKSIATSRFIGFKWRDETPSGALSIQWYNDFINTGDEDILQRILEYNEDDCKATMAVKDYLKKRMDTM